VKDSLYRYKLRKVIYSKDLKIILAVVFEKYTHTIAAIPYI